MFYLQILVLSTFVYSSGSTRTPRISGGRLAHTNEYPYMAAIFVRVRNTPVFAFICGGSIYNKNYTITAGHCLFKKDGTKIAPEDVRLVVGAKQVKVLVREDSKDLLPVNSTVVHHNFTTGSLFFLLNDIAMVKLQNPLTFSNAVKKLRIASTDESPYDGLGDVIGWGRTESYFPLQRPPAEPTGTLPTLDLKTARLRILPNTLCMIRHLSAVPKSILCVGSEGLLDSQSACFGDSGGPLACRGGSGPYLCGLVSTGLGCGLRFTPGFYTAINEYNGWIRSIGGVQ